MENECQMELFENLDDYEGEIDYPNFDEDLEEKLELIFKCRICHNLIDLYELQDKRCPYCYEDLSMRIKENDFFDSDCEQYIKTIKEK